MYKIDRRGGGGWSKNRSLGQTPKSIEFVSHMESHMIDFQIKELNINYHFCVNQVPKGIFIKRAFPSLNGGLPNTEDMKIRCIECIASKWRKKKVQKKMKRKS